MRTSLGIILLLVSVEAVPIHFCFVCNTHCSKIIVIIFNMGLICSAHMMERSVVVVPGH